MLNNEYYGTRTCPRRARARNIKGIQKESGASVVGRRREVVMADVESRCLVRVSEARWKGFVKNEAMGIRQC